MYLYFCLLVPKKHKQIAQKYFKKKQTKSYHKCAHIKKTQNSAHSLGRELQYIYLVLHPQFNANTKHYHISARLKKKLRAI